MILCFVSNILNSQSLTELKSQRVHLPNGWSLTPTGKQYPLGDLPLNMAISKNKKYLAITNNGQSEQTIQLFDIKSEKELDNIVIAKSWYGLKFSDDGQYLYASGGNDNLILRYYINHGKLIVKDSILLGKPWPEKISPAGIELDETNNLLFVVTKENKSLYFIDLITKKIQNKIELGSEGYCVLLSPDRQYLYVSLWGNKSILKYNLKSNTISNRISVGDHPNEMVMNKSGRYLFVANANDNSVSVIDTQTDMVIETLNAALYPDSPPGSTTNGLALSENQKTLYIANADNNCLSVFDISSPGKSKSIGFIPTGWYPTNVKVIGKKIYVSNGKGLSSKANPLGPSPYNSRQTVTYQQGDPHRPQQVEYIAGLFTGSLSVINEPNSKQSAIYSEAVYQNTPYSKQVETITSGEIGNPVPMKVGDASPIKHVFYIIKENRTYDQVLSDVAGGNGDTSLLLFGKNITPNLHKIVSTFVLLDNFYCDAEVSADGHNWSMGAYATDYLEKTWPTSYGGRGGSYDAEGNRPIANNKNGFIWDLCKLHGITYRTYGEFADFSTKPNIAVLNGHTCPNYSGWNLDIRDTTRFYQWKKEFDSLVTINAVPQFNTIRFGNDHTEGLRKNRPTPYAFLADNDLAVGLFIEYLSNSPIWKESVVFIVEDDAQNGPDHVDAHRSTAYVISPYIKRNFVDHTMYSSSSVLRTIELILGMPPMTQFDAAATPMWRSFTSKPDFSLFTHLPALVNLNDKNDGKNKMAIISERYDWSKEDRVPDLVFNQILWQGLKGQLAPPLTRSAFVKPQNATKKDDD